MGLSIIAWILNRKREIMSNFPRVLQGFLLKSANFHRRIRPR